MARTENESVEAVKAKAGQRPRRLFSNWCFTMLSKSISDIVPAHAVGVVAKLLAQLKVRVS